MTTWMFGCLIIIERQRRGEQTQGDERATLEGPRKSSKPSVSHVLASCAIKSMIVLRLPATEQAVKGEREGSQRWATREIHAPAQSLPRSNVITYHQV